MDWVGDGFDDPIPVYDDQFNFYNDDPNLLMSPLQSPTKGADDSDVLLLDEVGTPLSTIRKKKKAEEAVDEPAIEGVPKRRDGDDMKRFSFGVGRRSLSQPVLPVTPKGSSSRQRPKALLPLFSQIPVDNHKKEEEEQGKAGPSSAHTTPVKKQKGKGGARKQQTVPDEFFGVYCLISRSTLRQYKNRCYIGYTVDPNRRIRQHNGGKEAGGAKKTDNRGPWDMVCIIHGFPCNVAALRFEWAWQNPEKSRALKGKGVEKKGRKETPFGYRLRVACHLINCDPWKKLALTFRWLIPTEELPFPSEIPPPKHVIKKYGLVEKTTTKVPNEENQLLPVGSCAICKVRIEKLADLLRCPHCSVHYHVDCLCKYGLGKDFKKQLFPTQMNCSKCAKSFLWGDVIRDQRMILKVDEAQREVILKGRVPLREQTNQ